MTNNASVAPALNWLGFPSPFPPATCHAGIPRAPTVTTLGTLLNHRGDAVAREATEVGLWYDDRALHLRAQCLSAAMDRVRALAAQPVPYARDAWGDDALEVQIDVGRTRERYRHFILPPNGLAITFIGSNNRQEQGWHPQFAYHVSLEDQAWTLEAEFPFAMLGRAPVAGEIWGFNVMRVNRTEPTGYVQWAPTFGEALRSELFGEIQFGGGPGDRPAEIAACARRAAERQTFFRDTINGVREPDALRALGVADWETWGRYLAQRAGPVPLRWEEIAPGRDGIYPHDRAWTLEMAGTLVEQIAGWSLDPPDPKAFAIEPLEALGDAYLLTGERRYVDAFERALVVHARRLDQIQAGVTGPDQLPYTTNPYHDAQIIRAEMLAYVYLSMRQAGLPPATHAIMMWTVLRGCRFAAFNISSDYTYGNHQVYESGGLAAVAALFPEFPESAQWAAVASRSIRLHLEREVYPDGGYAERCGYHSVALSYVMHAVATIRANGVESRFADLMAPGTLGALERMHEWLLHMTGPTGHFPAFGDCGAASQLRFLRRGAAVFGRGDFAWPLRHLAPHLVPSGLEPREPARLSVALESQFTVLRDGWSPDAFFMAIDHGPLGGQHSHLDTLGFVACAYGRLVALDTGIGTSYEDRRYLTWFRALRAHNVIAIDDLETEKVAERISWEPGAQVDVVRLRSHAYEHALGLIQERTIAFIKGVGWLILDRLTGPAGFDLAAHRVDWLLHTPYQLVAEAPGVLHGAEAGGGLLVVAGAPAELEAPVLDRMPASVPVPEALELRLWDAVRRYGPRMTPAITSLSWRRKPVSGPAGEFVVALVPYRGPRPAVHLQRDAGNWVVEVNRERAACVRA